MNFSKQQVKRLSPWEPVFDRVCNSHILRGVGCYAIGVMQEVWQEATGKPRSVNNNCSDCVFEFLTDVGRVYFESKNTMVEETDPMDDETPRARTRRSRKYNQ